jgi:hypothetical protein
MRIPRKDVMDLGEYKITINYDGDGGLQIMVYDELGDEIEGIEISDDVETDDSNDQIQINPN